MSRKGLLYVLGVVALMLSVTVAGQALAGKKKLTRDRAALQAVAQAKDRATERRIDSLIRRMTLEEKLNQLTLLSDGQMKENPAEARKPVGSVFSETDRADQQLPARRGRELTPGHSDPLRLRHDPRLPDDLPHPTRHRQQLRSGRREDRPPDRRLRVRGRGAQADLQPDGRPLTRAALGPDRRGGRRGSVPQLRHGCRA